MNGACRLLLPILLALGAVASAAEPLPDPMRPSYVRSSGGPRHTRVGQSYRLQGVFGDERRRVAVVNGRVLRPGERLGRAVLQRIGPHHVELRSGRRSWRLHLSDHPR